MIKIQRKPVSGPTYVELQEGELYSYLRDLARVYLPDSFKSYHHLSYEADGTVHGTVLDEGVTEIQEIHQEAACLLRAADLMMKQCQSKDTPYKTSEWIGEPERWRVI